MECYGSYFGAGSRNRTRDLLITNQLLYQLSYAGAQAIFARIGAPVRNTSPLAGAVPAAD
jgi:hypothetical protein